MMRTVLKNNNNNLTTTNYTKDELLTREEEIELSKMIMEGGENAKAALGKLVEANMGLVPYVIKNYFQDRGDMDDLMSYGYEGLVIAAHKYDYTVGTRFSTYACTCIKNVISESLRKESNLIVIPNYMSTLQRKVINNMEKLENELFLESSTSNIAEISGLSEDEVIAAKNAMYSVVSLCTPIGDDDSTLEDVLIDNNSVDPYKEYEKKELRSILEKAMDELTEKERKIIKTKFEYDIETIKSFAKIGVLPEVNVSKERVRQLHDQALVKMRLNNKNELEPYYEESYR